ncbi:MAG: hypothetical protein IPL83_03885 [Bdellovibrionales bacterium]|nr:hypothetical protein [Bdellovibrionales bacterium]
MAFSIQARGATEFINGAKFIRCNKANQCIELSSDQMQRTSMFPILAFGMSQLKIYEMKEGTKSSNLIRTWKANEGYIDLSLNRIVLRQLQQVNDRQEQLELIYFIDSGKTLLL